MSAEIVAFPAPRARSAPEQWHADAPAHPDDAHLDDTGQDRLRRALTTLSAANAAQHHAVAQWRQALSALQTSILRLESRLLHTRDTLDRLQDDVSDLQAFLSAGSLPARKPHTAP